MKPKVLAFALLIAFSVAFVVTRLNAVAIPPPPSSRDSADIQRSIERFYDLLEMPDRQSAAAQLHTVLADTEDYVLRPEHKAAIKQAFGDPVPSHGYMTSVSATLTVLGAANTVFADAKAKANAAGRELSVDEIRELNNKTGGLGGSATGKSEKPRAIKYSKIEVSGSRAVTVYETSASIQEVILIKRDSHWYITSLVIIKNLV